MNVFATELGLPANNLKRCWEIIQENRTRPVDLPSANGKHFVQLAGVGLDAQAVKETSRAFKRNFGPLSYLISAAQIASRPPPVLRIESEDAVTEEGSFVLIGNGRLYGGRFPFFKQAVMDDGLLDVIVFKRLNYVEIIRYLQNVDFHSANLFAGGRVFPDEAAARQQRGKRAGRNRRGTHRKLPGGIQDRAGGLRVLAPL